VFYLWTFLRLVLSLVGGIRSSPYGDVQAGDHDATVLLLIFADSVIWFCRFTTIHEEEVR
jgi:hypothetical protein